MVDGDTFTGASAWGKHLFHHYRGGRIIHVHLGLYGRFDEFALAVDEPPPDPVGQVRMRIVGADEVDFMALHALEPDPDVRLYVLHDVADMECAVGVGQGGGDEKRARLWLAHREMRSVREIGTCG